MYNGENFLGAAIQSILDQTYADFELIISDNASTDSTQEICLEFARLDKRIRYIRNARNLGADPNYNAVFAASGGEYFKWAAHDDVLAPTFLERCIDALEENPGAVLAQSLVRVIDEHGQTLGSYDSALDGAGSGHASDRYASAILVPHWCTEVFGVIRRSALAQTSLHGGYHHSDRVLLAQLALLGRFVQVKASLFGSRDHDARYVRIHRDKDRVAWHDTSRSEVVDFAIWRMIREYNGMISRYVDDKGEQLRCRRHLLRWFFVNWNAARLVIEPLGGLDPRIGAVFRRMKRKIEKSDPALRDATGPM
ncbi:MAG: glycosyltransferase [Alphaproteobacteria bacterium]|nr:glycosyltransferase [Alphaproteobacteria bacterium]